MKVGETIEINGVMLEATAEISDKQNECCEGCYFYDENICPEDEDKNLLCTKEDIIIFKEVKK